MANNNKGYTASRERGVPRPYRLPTSLSETERQAVVDAAARHRVSVSEFIRTASVTAANRVLGQGSPF